MPKKVTKALLNRYCQARMRAAEYNPDFSSRRGAVEHLSGISEDALKKYELGICNPSNDVVAIMADAYNAPELVSWYCCNECALGRNCSVVEERTPEQALLRLVNVGKDFKSAVDTLSLVLDDGEITEDEAESVSKAKITLLEVYHRVNELLVNLDRIERK